MTIKYVYKNKEYNLVRELIQEIWKDSRVLVKIPTKNEVEFWEKYGVTYTEEPDPQPMVEDVRTQKLIELDSKFLDWYETDATLISSLGFECDSDARAMMDINGLVIKAQSAVFMDANNQPHEVTLEELKVIQLEIIDAGNAAYQRKWELREAINAAETIEDLDAIEITFTPVDFSGVSENVF